MTLQDRIVHDSAICGGQPTLRGTRVLLRTVLGYLAHDERTESLLSDFPTLTKDDVRAAIAFAAASFLRGGGLSERDTRRVLELLENPPKPAARLVEAARARRRAR